MPRSYGFDHFTVPTSGEPRPRRGKKPADRPAHKGRRKAPAVQSPREATAEEPSQPPRPAPAPAEGLDQVWARAGQHVREAREGASATLRAGRALARLPLLLVRALRGARHRG
jgi:hypothetical protein